MFESSSHSRRWFAIALVGPILAGAILGLRGGPLAMAVFALGLPAILAAVTLLTAPTLYVGGAVLGSRLSLADVATATGRALHATGLALLGVAPLGLLLCAMLPAPAQVPAQAILLVVVALVVGLHRLRTELRTDAGAGPVAANLLLATHAVVAFIIGARLFHDLYRLNERISS